MSLLVFFVFVVVGVVFLMQLVLGTVIDTYMEEAQEELRSKRVKQAKGLMRAFAVLDLRKEGHLRQRAFDRLIQKLRPSDSPFETRQAPGHWDTLYFPLIIGRIICRNSFQRVLRASPGKALEVQPALQQVQVDGGRQFRAFNPCGEPQLGGPLTFGTLALAPKAADDSTSTTATRVTPSLQGLSSGVSPPYPFWDTFVPYRTESVHFFGGGF